MKNCNIFLIFAQNMNCGYTLESMFYSKNKKIMYTPVYPNFAI